MNRINYSQWTFTDKDIVSGSVAMSNALMFDSLNPDELTVEVVSGDTGKRKVMVQPLTTPNPLEWYTTNDNRGYVVMTGDIRQFTYGTPLWYYYDNALQGKFYIRSVDRLSIDHFRLNAFSVVGMWTNIQHFGGVYNGELTRNVVADLLSGFTYTIDSDVGEVPLYGWLPVASVRDNLQQVLFAIGAALMKNGIGNPHIKFLKNTPVIPVGDDRIYIGGQLSYKTPATTIQVTEHSFYQSALDVRESLFDNSDGQSGSAANQLVTFETPHYDLQWNGASVTGGDNYYIANGNGILTGKPYTHTTKVFTVQTGVTGEPREAKVDKATLVSPVNSANVAARVADYQSTAEEVACGIVMSDDDIKCGTKVSFNDPYGAATQGLVSQMNLTMSGKSKADCTIVKGYVPSHFGNNFKNCKVITSDTTWTIPSGTTLLRLVLGQGGQAGQSGYNGTGSETGRSSWNFGTTPGLGGEAGVGGSAGKVHIVDISNPSGTISFSIGAKGNPVYTEGATGGAGGHTTATYNSTTYTSDSGSILPEGYRDVINGTTYSVSGIDGVHGADGGGLENGDSTEGNGITYGSSSWTGGTVGARIERKNGLYWGNGGCGGGAAYSVNGNNGGDAYINENTGRPNGGRGGDGASAGIMSSYTPTLGSGGAGGCGGGGGGCPGRDYTGTDNATGGYGFGSDSSGGSYSAGTKGGAGYALVFY